MWHNVRSTSNVDRYFKGIKTESAIKALHENVPIEDLEDHVEFVEIWTAFLAIPQIPGGRPLKSPMPAEQMDYVQHDFCSSAYAT